MVVRQPQKSKLTNTHNERNVEVTSYEYTTKDPKTKLIKRQDLDLVFAKNDF